MSCSSGRSDNAWLQVWPRNLFDFKPNKPKSRRVWIVLDSLSPIVDITSAGNRWTAIRYEFPFILVNFSFTVLSNVLPWILSPPKISTSFQILVNGTLASPTTLTKVLGCTAHNRWIGQIRCWIDLQVLLLQNFVFLHVLNFATSIVSHFRLSPP